MTYTIEDAYQDTVVQPFGDLLAFSVGFLYAKTALEEEFEWDDLPEPLQEFIGSIFSAADEFEVSRA